MHITSIRLQNFRNYKDHAVELSPSINIVVGPNASGKTNLLEAILVSSLGSSYRDKDIELIEFESDWARIDAVTDEDQKRVTKIKRTGEKSEKEIEIDDIKLKRLSAQRSYPITLFEPEHLRIVHGSPELRRTYLDGILNQTEPGFSSIRRKYKRALSQRNRLLKEDRIAEDELFVWDVNIADYGAEIVRARTELIERINKDSSKIYSKLSGSKDKLQLKYLPTVEGSDYTNAILKNLKENLQRDRLRGFTSVGPHREDIEFILNGHDAQHSASRGETRTIVLMCKLIEMQLIEEETGNKPTLLLDDVFSELDSSRRRSLTEYLKDYQTIITTTDADAIIEHFMDGTYKIIPTAN